MSILLALLLATACGNAGVGGLSVATPVSALFQEGSSPSFQAQERIVIHKDGGPGHGPDQPFSVREQGARDLEGFLGGKYIVMEGPIDLLVILLIVVLVVVLIIIL
jgi:hypothetical protein